jgi:hypothetical protein
LQNENGGIVKMKKILISGPVLSKSGYGEMARLALRSLKPFESEYDLYVNPLNWGATGWLHESSEERDWIDSLIQKANQYVHLTNGRPEYDISIQITIPNEWKKLATVNIGYTAGIETNFISPAWFEPIQQMDKVIVISNHAKSSIVNAQFMTEQGGSVLKVTTPVEVVHFPVKDTKEKQVENVDFSTDFNFLSVCQWGPRKNLEQTITNFIEEFRNENVGLVLKINAANDSIIDKNMCEERLETLLQNYKERKCKIYLLHGFMTEEEMTSLYRHSKIKAIISTTHGEGFGLPLFEAAYNELPVLATDWSGHLDFLTSIDEDGAEKKLFSKINYELAPVDDKSVWPGVVEKGTSWAYPIASSVKERMREVYKDYNRFKSWSKKLNKWIRATFTEEAVHGKFAKCILGDDANAVSVSDLPKISFITSLYNGDEYIEGFMKTITDQSIFKEKCELVIVNCNSPGNEEPIVKSYMDKFPENIKYIKLDHDPGIYAAWNIAIKQATGEFISNANLDDRKHPKFAEELAKSLVKNQDVDLVYADNLLCNNANETWDANTANTIYPSEAWTMDAMLRGNPPHCMPMWRKTLHDKNGYFEEKYRSASDWEMWLRSAFNGSKMLKVNKLLGLYYFNPKGMSTNKENNSWKRAEEKEIFKKYISLKKEKQINA